MAINNLKNELDYFDFSYQPGLEQSQRISKFVGNIYVSIITYYEGSSNIEQTYLSLYNQTFPHWEWLIVTNNIDQTLLDLKKRDKRIKILEITKKGNKEGKIFFFHISKEKITELVISLEFINILTHIYNNIVIITNLNIFIKSPV